MPLEIYPEMTSDDAKLQRCFMRRVVLAILLAAFLGGSLIYWSKAHAVQRDPQGCQGLAVWSHDIPLMRDLGANKEKVRAYLESKKTTHAIFQILTRRFEQLWATTEPLENIMQGVFEDCHSRRGQYGTDT